MNNQPVTISHIANGGESGNLKHSAPHKDSSRWIGTCHANRPGHVRDRWLQA